MKTSSCKNRAFSLIELIVVILIIGIIAAFTLPAASTILRGSQITQASQIITDQFSLARQTALTKNRSVEVRLIRYGDPETPGESITDKGTWNYRAIQIMEILENGVAVPLDKPQLLPQAVIMNPTTLSTLIAGPDQTSTAPVKSDPNLPRKIGQNYDYVSFRFLPDGSTNLAEFNPSSATKNVWYVTLHNINDYDAKTPANTANRVGTGKLNYFTLQVDPVSGKTKSYRPSV